MQWQNMLDGFQFQDDLAVDYKVRAVATVEHEPVIVQRQVDLPRIGKRMPVELMTQASFVCVFQQPKAETRMHAHGQTDDAMGEAIVAGSVHALPSDCLIDGQNRGAWFMSG
jgi:hypothetical protein